MTNIAIIEDDKALNEGIALALGGEGHRFFHCYTLKEARALSDVDLVILDINLPDGSGLDFLKSLRQRSNVPVLILTANDSELDEVAGLELGADDYMTKPFSLMVMRARVDKLLQKKSRNPVFVFEELSLDFLQMDFRMAGKPLELSRTEQRLLYLLVENAGRPVSREQLLDYVWDTEFVEENVLSVTVKRIRDKLETIDRTYIQTVYGVGYMWKPVPGHGGAL